MKRTGGEGFLGIETLYQRFQTVLKDRAARRGNTANARPEITPPGNIIPINRLPTERGDVLEKRELVKMPLGGCNIFPASELPPAWFEGKVPNADYATVQNASLPNHPRFIKPDEYRELNPGMKRIPVLQDTEEQATSIELANPIGYIDVPDPIAHEAAREQWKSQY